MHPLQMMANRIINNNPQALQLYNDLKDKTPQEKEQYARNFFQSKGVDIKQFLSTFGVNI